MVSSEDVPGSGSNSGARALYDRIARARAALRRAAILEAVVVLVTGLVLAVGIGAALSAFSISPTGTALAEALLVLATVVFVAIRYGPLVVSHLDSDEGVARLVDEAARTAGLRLDLLSAVELARDRGRFGQSEALSDLAIEDASEAAEDADVPALVRGTTHRTLKRALVPLGFAAALFAGFALLAPRFLTDALRAPTAMGDLEEALRRVPPEPRLGDIRLSYRFPAYANRAPRTVESPSGRIFALPGTEVVIETSARRPVREAALLVSHGDRVDDEAQRIAVEISGRQLRTTLVLSRSGRYRFRVVGEDGELMEERRGHEIELEVDEVPEVTLESPAESPLEVNERDRLTLAFSAKDDFLLGETFVVWRVLQTSREGRVRLTSATSGERRYRGQAELDLATLQLQPGDRVAYSVEVRDNDTVNGPKAGASETKELRVYSKKAHHAQVLALEEQSLDELVHILGDNLERAFALVEDNARYKGLLESSTKIVERAMAADELLKRTVAAIRKDPMGRPQVADAFEQARRELNRVTSRKRRAVRNAAQSFERHDRPDARTGKAVTRSQDKMVASLEKNVVYLADLLNDQRLIDAEALAKELREQQQALRQALEDFKNAPTEDKRALIAESIKAIRERIQEIMKELSKLKSSIPQDFMNQDALDAQDSEQKLDEMQRMLEEGDLDAAMEALDRMLNQTEKMLSELQGGREELQSREYSEITQTANRLWKNLEEVAEQERELAKKTEQLSKNVLDRMRSRLGDPKAFVEKQKKRLQMAAKSMERVRPEKHMPDFDLFELTERRLEDGLRALEAQDFGAAKDVLDKATQQMTQLERDAARRVDSARRYGDVFGMSEEAERTERALRRARPAVDEVLKDIESLMPSPDSLLSENERQQLSKLQKQQAALEKQTQGIGQDLEKLGQQLPIVGPEVQQMIGDAAKSMQEAQESMGQGDAPSALNQERNALDKLQQLRQELEKMGENGGGGGGGVPLPFGQAPSGGREDGNGTERNPEKVEIPKPEQYKAPAEFREDILEAAKQGTVEQYKDAVRRYYEELVK